MYPKYIPKMPAIPAIALGAGIGNLRKPKTNPTIAPVNKDNMICI